MPAMAMPVRPSRVPCFAFLKQPSSPRATSERKADPRAFSSEVDTGSREENATNQKPGVFQRVRETV
jgi:hypothetical protein